jgi:AcrR family transcriptional regulator
VEIGGDRMSRDEKILQAAVQLFYERGFDAVGVDEIGGLAGITGPAIYRHFRGKQEILATLFDRALDALLTRVGGAVDDPMDELRHLVTAHTAFVIENVRLAAVYHREERSLDASHRRQWARREQSYVERWIACLSDLCPQRGRDELTGAAWAAMSLLGSVGFWPADARRSENLSEVLRTQILGGLLALAGAGAGPSGRATEPAPAPGPEAVSATEA